MEVELGPTRGNNHTRVHSLNNFELLTLKDVPHYYNFDTAKLTMENLFPVVSHM